MLAGGFAAGFLFLGEAVQPFFFCGIVIWFAITKPGAKACPAARDYSTRTTLVASQETP
jgi:hypothetical protein